MLPPDRSQGTCGAGSWGPGAALGMRMPGWDGPLKWSAGGQPGVPPKNHLRGFKG